MTFSFTITLAPASNDPKDFHYVVETPGKRRRSIRAVCSTLEEAEQIKGRIKAQWQPTIYPMYVGPYTEVSPSAH